MLTMKQNRNNTEGLLLLGIQRCKGCGNAISIESKICYKCNFNELEKEILPKERKFNFQYDEKIYIVVPINKTKHNPKNHLFRGSNPLCNSHLKSYDYRTDAVLTNKTASKFQENGCKGCALHLDHLLEDKSN